MAITINRPAHEQPVEPAPSVMDDRALAGLLHAMTVRTCMNCERVLSLDHFDVEGHYRVHTHWCCACRVKYRKDRPKPPPKREIQDFKTCTQCGERKAFTSFYQSNGRAQARCKKCHNKSNQQKAKRKRGPDVLLNPIEPEQKPGAYVGEMPISRFEAATFLRKHEADSPFRYAGAGVVVRDDMSEAALAYLSRFKR